MPKTINSECAPAANHWLGPYKTGDEALDAARRAVAECIGADPDVWPEHKNAPLAIAAVVAIRQSAYTAAEAVQPEPADTLDADVEKSWHRLCLENCRLYAARHRKEEWAKTILRFCEEAGVNGSPLRAALNTARNDELKAAQEADELRAALAAETRRWEEAMRLTWQMVDPLKPAGSPGSYARGQDSGIVAALTTLRANLK